MPFEPVSTNKYLKLTVECFLSMVFCLSSNRAFILSGNCMESVEKPLKTVSVSKSTGITGLKRLCENSKRECRGRQSAVVFRSSLPTDAFLPLVSVQLVGACADELNQKESKGASSVG